MTVPVPSEMTAWRPGVAGIEEVLHARLVGHGYPMHAHATWTVLLLDDGAVRYDLDHHAHGAATAHVTVLPPHVPHNGTPATPDGLRKRVLYLDEAAIGPSQQLIGRAADRPGIADPLLRRRLDQLHGVLAAGRGEELEAESRLAFVAERIGWHLRRQEARPPGRGRELAEGLRELLQAYAVEGIALREAAGRLHAHPAHLVRAFTRRFAMPPHQYLISLRVDAARRLLLDGCPPPEAAARAGFYDQSHLTRHFRRVMGVPPGRYARGAVTPRS
ncbi:AraC family transcriptional regulator [Streptomyces sp. 6N223]|uniref:AraC family transcriptional regulator n=1 Tax=Streptomyces sp. 6N223 TaxID=3457412 RepID=UPI003FD38155